MHQLLLNVVDIGGLPQNISQQTIGKPPYKAYTSINPLPTEAPHLTGGSYHRIRATVFSSSKSKTLYIPRNISGASLFPPNLEYVRDNVARLERQGDSSLAASWAERSATVSTTEVDTTTLDDLYKQSNKLAHIDLLKIDSNGSELDILKGGRNTLEQHCSAVFLKLFTEPLFRDAPQLSEVIDFFLSMGYRLEACSPPQHTFLSQRYCVLTNTRQPAETILPIRQLLHLPAQPAHAFNWPQTLPGALKNPLIILGNGPSLASVDFTELHGYHTCGFNAAYRGFARKNYWPTYLASLDYNLTPSHAKAFCNLICQETHNAIQKFFFINSVSWLRHFSPHVHIIPGWKESLREYPKSPLLGPDHSTFHWCGNSAATMVEVFLNMGYRDFILLGVDANYTEKLPFANESSPGELEIQKTPESNPNYWFSDYQQVGDKYSVPNAATAHIAAWHKLAKYSAERGDIRIINGSLSSKLECFPKCDWRAALNYFATTSTSGANKSSHNSSQNAAAVERGFGPEEKVVLDEALLIARILSDQESGTVIDVGAHHGSTLRPFVSTGWRALAFEPDENNRAVLRRNFGNLPNVIIDSRAVGNKPQESVPFFTSAESSGLSGLSAFTDGHKNSGTVSVTTLEQAIAKHSLGSVDFLKIDTEGFDLFVLQGFPWDTHKPRVVLCEFEDAKTIPLGYELSDLANFLSRKGFEVFLSEWHPIVRYGITHSFKRLLRWPVSAIGDRAWGNLIAFSRPEDARQVFAVGDACINRMR